MSNMISLAERMKGYENIPKNFLMRRTPVIIRLDGAHFKNFTRTLDKVFLENSSAALSKLWLKERVAIAAAVLTIFWIL